MLGKGKTNFITSTEIQTEQMYPTNFSVINKKIALSLHYNKSESYLFVYSIEPGKFKAAEQMYPTNFSVINKKFALSLHYNKSESYLFVYSIEPGKFKAADSGILSDPICLGCISYDDTHGHKSGLDGYVYEFSVGYKPTKVDEVKKIHKYLINKHGIV